MSKQHFIPTMFHRRLLLLSVAMALVLGVLGLQASRLSVAQGARHLGVAESRLQRVTYLPTYRGAIYDRHGQLLAVDQPSYDIAVPFSVVTGAYVTEQARKDAITEIGSSAWAELSPEAQADAALSHAGAREAECARLWQLLIELGGIDEETLERRLDAIRQNVQATAAAVWENQRRRDFAKSGLEDESAFAFRPMPIREQKQAHVILPRVHDQVAFAFRKIALDMPGMLEVQHSLQREYPWRAADVVLDRSTLPGPLRSDVPITVRVIGVADHLLGSVRDEIWAEDRERRPFVVPETGALDLGGYRLGDAVGDEGLERSLEDFLRGRRGVIYERRDTGEQQRLEPIPGRDVHLTIDVALQARVQAILSPEFGLTKVQTWHRNEKLPPGRPLNSAAVVIEIATGEVLAAVSMPTATMGAELEDAQRAQAMPWVNRAVEAIYPPGSILKPLVLNAAVNEGHYHRGESIECKGQYFPEVAGAARCWIYRERWHFQTHGPLLADEGLARSCNFFFYTLADRIGMPALVDHLDQFGVNRRLDTGLLYLDRDEERTFWTGGSAGALPTDSDIERLRKSGQLRFSTVILGIGQGPIAWTPLHAANAYATLARGGVIRDATFLRDDPRGTPPPRPDIDVEPWLVDLALEGLRQAAGEDYGTGHHIRYDDGTAEPIINATGVTARAKTGTAQAPPIDLDGNGEIDEGAETDLDHSWFVGLVESEGTEEPLYAIAVIVEHGGSGGRVAGPVANQIVHALQEEGYLPRSEP